MPIETEVRQSDPATPKQHWVLPEKEITAEKYVVLRRLLCDVGFHRVGSFASPAERLASFSALLDELEGWRPREYVEYYFAEIDSNCDYVNRETWARHEPRGIVLRYNDSIADLQNLIRAILREGGHINPQMNRITPREGSNLVEPLSAKFIEALWAMKGELFQHPRPSRNWYAGPWGLLDVVPVICREVTVPLD